MTTQAIIRAGLRTLVASFFATCLLAAWPLSVQAGKGGGGGGGVGRVQHSDLTVQKHFDKASPKLYEAASSGKHFDNVIIERPKSGGTKQYIKYELKNTYISN
jgi:type VI secretion system Hcp family effector